MVDDAAIRGLVGSRLRDTAFSQGGFHAKLALRPGADQSLTLWYQQSDQTGADGYKDLWGGLGRMESRFEPQRLRFGYARYEKLNVAGLDSWSGAFSVNLSPRKAFNVFISTFLTLGGKRNTRSAGSFVKSSLSTLRRHSKLAVACMS